MKARPSQAEVAVQLRTQGLEMQVKALPRQLDGLLQLNVSAELAPASAMAAKVHRRVCHGWDGLEVNARLASVKRVKTSGMRAENSICPEVFRSVQYSPVRVSGRCCGPCVSRAIVP